MLYSCVTPVHGVHTAGGPRSQHASLPPHCNTTLYHHRREIPRGCCFDSRRHVSIHEELASVLIMSSVSWDPTGPKMCCSLLIHVSHVQMFAPVCPAQFVQPISFIVHTQPNSDALYSPVLSRQHPALSFPTPAKSCTCLLQQPSASPSLSSKASLSSPTPLTPAHL